MADDQTADYKAGLVPQSAGNSASSFRTGTEPSGDYKAGLVPQQAPAAKQDDSEVTYDKLTAGYNPDAEKLGPAGQLLDSVGGTVMGLPGGIANAVMHPIDTAQQTASSIGSWFDPKTRPTWEGIKSVLPQALGVGIGNVAGGEMMGAAAGALKPGASGGGPGALRTAGQDVMNEGPAKANFLGRQYDEAMAHQDHIQQGVANVKQDAVQAITDPAQKIDAASPGGIIDKAKVKADLTDVVNDIAGDDRSQVPASLKKFIAEDKPSTKTTGPAIGGRTLDLSNADDLRAFQKFKAQGVFTPQELARMEGTSSGGKMSFQDLMSERSKLGDEMQGLEGQPKAIAGAAYQKLSQTLRSAASDAGFEKEWLDGNDRYKQYRELSNALDDTLRGQDPSDIMKPFSDKSRVRVMNLIDKYGPEFGFDRDKITDSANRFNFGEKMDKFSDPTRRMTTLKTIAKVAGIPRMLRSGTASDVLYGKGFDAPKISPRKVYPTKAAAMAAKRGNP